METPWHDAPSLTLADICVAIGDGQLACQLDHEDYAVPAGALRQLRARLLLPDTPFPQGTRRGSMPSSRRDPASLN